ncbi:protocadherin alpha-2-like isoform X2 [Acipenser ruthenus]|uniref:protocadherin alpha-2-like isoform X2 n=1 Tax=Acipenser ruthenus TaxID=7906 RepID=UPI00274298C7|nr:protocadherin alpha-2-like isoform X2 [Acipenser ruthenus]
MHADRLDFHRTPKWKCVCFIFLSCFWEATTGQIRYRIQEELEVGTFVGNIVEDLGLDVNALSARKFRMSTGAKKKYTEVNLKNGIVFINDRIDREDICGQTLTCFLNLEIVLENPLEMHYAEIEILDVNDNSPIFPEPTMTLEIAEQVLPGARFSLESAHDPDTGKKSLASYKLSPSEYFQLHVETRNEHKKVPFLVLRKQLDRELQSVHNLVLTAVDGGSPERSGTVDISITVLDSNDNPPVFAKQIYAVSVLENASIGTPVIKLNASDADEGSNGKIRFFFSDKTMENVREAFSIDSNSGEIQVKGLLDFEEKSDYDIEFVAEDEGQPSMVAQCSVIVKIIDVNDNAPLVTVSSLSNPLKEDTPVDTVVALISVTDADSGDNAKVKCSLSPNVPFKLKPSFKTNFYSLVIDGFLDRETTPEYNVTITATDFGSPPLYGIKTVRITISDVNDNPPRFEQSFYSLYIQENNAPGASIFQITALDPDSMENGKVSYSVFEKQIDDRPVSAILSINPENGNIYALNSFDCEKLKNFHFEVQAKDNGLNPLTSNVTVHVYILDQNDNAPVILSPLSNSGSLVAVEKVPRSVNTGFLVTKIRANDADIGYNAWVSFKLSDITDPSLFAVGLYTGEIRTRRLFVDTDVALHKLTITVKDGGSPSLSATVNMDIEVVENTEENVPLFSTSFKDQFKSPDDASQLTLYLIITLGSISFLFLVSVIALVTTHCYKARCHKSNQTFAPYLNYGDGSAGGSLFHTYRYQMHLSQECSKHDSMTGTQQIHGDTLRSNGNMHTQSGFNEQTIIVDENGTKFYAVPRQPNTDWRYSASLRAGMQSSVLMEESAVLQGAPVVHVQNWPTVSSATPEPDAGEVSPPVGAGINSNSWTFKYGPGNHHQQQQQQQQLLKPGEVPENFIIPGSPAIISIRQDQAGAVDGKGDFITFGKKEETKKKKKKKKGKADKKEKGGGNNDNSDH